MQGALSRLAGWLGALRAGAGSRRWFGFWRAGCVGAGGTRLGGWSARTSGRAVRSAAWGCFMDAGTGSTGTGRAESRCVGRGRGLLLAAPGVGIGEREARGEKREREPVGRERNGRETLVAAAAPLEAYRVQL
jgi:hypothetical protein